MARKKRPEPPRLEELLPPVSHVPLQSLPFNEAWRAAARSRWLELKAMGIQQKDFAQWIGCAQGSISNILGEKVPVFWSTEYLQRLSLALGVDLPLKAQLYVLANGIGDDDVGLGKVLDLLSHYVVKK
jgi:hypothetical protein